MISDPIAQLKSELNVLSDDKIASLIFIMISDLTKEHDPVKKNILLNAYDIAMEREIFGSINSQDVKTLKEIMEKII